ncbi:pilin [Mycoplasma sp. T363T]|uniref:pilin n=1 Tax=Mycoplasma bradburyae TaxID=2963128 RepID=UPI0020CCC530|nr:pilin [Mycoplasma bradburyae]MDC4163043.1 pilin [Mycoplasma bradburyae]UTS70561.1 pilin [Mycoplasma bradburyae]
MNIIDKMNYIIMQVLSSTMILHDGESGIANPDSFDFSKLEDGLWNWGAKILAFLLAIGGIVFLFSVVKDAISVMASGKEEEKAAFKSSLAWKLLCLVILFASSGILVALKDIIIAARGS